MFSWKNPPLVVIRAVTASTATSQRVWPIPNGSLIDEE